MLGLAVTLLQLSTRVPGTLELASPHAQPDPAPRTHSYALQIQLKALSQQTPCWPGSFTTEAVLHAPTWVGSVGPQTHPNGGSAEQFIAAPPLPPALPPVPPAPASPPPAPPDPSGVLPSWPSPPMVPVPAA
jgi:hypothetical protein